MRRWIDDPRDPLIPRCFVQEELDEVGDGPDRIERLAGRFAAKEAVLKALGTGFGAGVAFSDVVIHRAAGAPPQVRLTGGAAKVAIELGITEWRLSWPVTVWKISSTISSRWSGMPKRRAAVLRAVGQQGLGEAVQEVEGKRPLFWTTHL